MDLRPPRLDRRARVCLVDRVGKGAIPDRAAIDEDVLGRVAGALGGERRHVAGQPDARRLPSDLDEVAAVPVDLEEAVGRRRHRRAGEQLPASARQPESDLRMRQGDLGDDARHLPRLGPVRLEELPAGGHVVEEIGDLDARPLGSPRGANLGPVAACHPNQRTVVRTARARPQLQPGDRHDARQRLAAEPVRRDGAQVLDRGQLARRVAFERQRGVFRAHPLAVVLDADEALAARFDGDGDPCRSGVEGVLDQLLHDGRGALDHLAGRDLVGEPGREPVDPAQCPRPGYRRASAACAAARRAVGTRYGDALT